MTTLERKANHLQYLAQTFRRTVLGLLHEAGSGHWGGSSSAAELITTLYFHILNTDPEKSRDPARDRFVLSKGHAAPMLYTVLAERGFFSVDELHSLRKINSRLQGHPCMKRTPGVEMSTGALGHGLSVALGMALAAPLQQLSYWTFVLIGDGDLNEGETWEGIMSAAKFKAQRLVIMVDYNRVQLDGHADEIMPTYPLADKLKAFGLNVAPGHYDGHKVTSILDSWEWIKGQKNWPVAVVYDTVKGKGISFTENNFKWHGAPVDGTTLRKGMVELDEQLEELKKHYDR
jgi:transketolase